MNEISLQSSIIPAEKSQENDENQIKSRVPADTDLSFEELIKGIILDPFSDIIDWVDVELTEQVLDSTEIAYQTKHTIRCIETVGLLHKFMLMLMKPECRTQEYASLYMKCFVIVPKDAIILFKVMWTLNRKNLREILRFERIKRVEAKYSPAAPIYIIIICHEAIDVCHMEYIGYSVGYLTDKGIIEKDITVVGHIRVNHFGLDERVFYSNSLVQCLKEMEVNLEIAIKRQIQGIHERRTRMKFARRKTLRKRQKEQERLERIAKMRADNERRLRFHRAVTNNEYYEDVDEEEYLKRLDESYERNSRRPYQKNYKKRDQEDFEENSKGDDGKNSEIYEGEYPSDYNNEYKGNYHENYDGYNDGYCEGEFEEEYDVNYNTGENHGEYYEHDDYEEEKYDKNYDEEYDRGGYERWYDEDDYQEGYEQHYEDYREKHCENYYDGYEADSNSNYHMEHQEEFFEEQGGFYDKNEYDDNYYPEDDEYYNRCDNESYEDEYQENYQGDYQEEYYDYDENQEEFKENYEKSKYFRDYMDDNNENGIFHFKHENKYGYGETYNEYEDGGHGICFEDE